MEIPRVTEILRAYTSYDKVPSEILERAAERGTSVHALCAAIARGDWVPDGMIRDDLKGYINSFKKWSEAQVAKFLVIEKRFSDQIRQYSGQIDFLVKATDDELYLIDLKTSSRPQKTYPVQMAAYEYLLKKHQITIKGAMLVYLNQAGDFPNVHLLEDMTEEFHIFSSALDCWHYFNKGNINGRKNRVSTARIETDEDIS